MGIAVRQIGRATLLGAGALATTLAAEVVAARRHRFLTHEQPLEISGTIGPEDGEPLTLVVLGDSSVAGVGADAAEDTLTYGVAKALSDQYRVSLHALGVSGSRLNHVVVDQLPQVEGLDPDIVLVCVGTNDVTHGTTLREARRQLQLLVADLTGGLAEAALDLWHSGARATLVHFGPTFDKKIKPWVLPDFTNRVAEGSIGARWNNRVVEIGRDCLTLRSTDGIVSTIPADHVYLMTGFAPNVEAGDTGSAAGRLGHRELREPAPGQAPRYPAHAPAQPAM